MKNLDSESRHPPREAHPQRPTRPPSPVNSRVTGGKSSQNNKSGQSLETSLDTSMVATRTAVLATSTVWATVVIVVCLPISVPYSVLAPRGAPGFGPGVLLMPRRGGACLRAASRGRAVAQATARKANAEAGVSLEWEEGELVEMELWKRAAWGNRYRVDVAYDGAACAGWQTWKNSAAQNRTAHYQVQLVLRTVLRAAELELISAGRTDAGVHVLCMPCHFDLPLSRTLDLVALGNGAHLIRREPSSLHLSHSSSSSLRSSCKLLLLAAARNLPTSSSSCQGPAY